MPIYPWVCETCKKKAEIMRGFDGYLDPPTEEEGGLCSADGPEEKPVEHAWEREIAAPLIAKSPGWGAKGYWALALALLTGLGGCVPVGAAAGSDGTISPHVRQRCSET